MQGIHLRKYGVEAKIPFVLYEVDGVDLRVDAADAGSDCTIMKDEGAEATCTNDFVDEGMGYSITLTATEMEAARIVVYVVDSATKVWLDDALIIETYGNASAQHAVDLDDGVRAGLTALPAAAADAAGGLPISDAGGLDLDTQLANTHEVTAARMGALTDWINGGRLDLILDIIAADTTTDIPALIATAQADLDTITGADGATISTASAASLVDDVWDEVITAHADASSAGLYLTSLYQTLVTRIGQCGDAGSATTIDLDAAASAVADFYKGQLIAIVAGTGIGQARTCTTYNGVDKIAEVSPAWATIPDGDSYFAILNTGSTVVVDWADGGRLDLILDIIAADTTTDIPALIAALENLSAAEAEAACDASLATYDAPTKAEMDTAHGLLATEAKQDTIDTVVDAIKVVTDNMAAAATTLVTGTVEEGAGPTTTVFQTNLAEATDDHFIGRIVIFTSGDNQNEATDITDYTGATGTITCTALTAAPAANDTFVIV